MGLLFFFFFKKFFKILFWLTSLRRIFKKFSGIEVTGPSQSLSSFSLMEWIGAWEPHVPWQAHIGWTRIKLLSLFGLQTIQNLLTLKKNEQAESTSEKGDYLGLWMLLLGMHKQYRWQHLTAKGAFWHWCRLSDVPLFHCNPDCVATLERWGLASKSCFISLFLSSLVIPFSYSWFIPLALSHPFVAPLSADLAGRWETGMVSLLNVLCSWPQASHIHPLWDVSVGKTTLEWPSGLHVFGGGESLAVGYGTSRRWLHFLPRSQGCTIKCSH